MNKLKAVYENSRAEMVSDDPEVNSIINFYAGAMAAAMIVKDSLSNDEAYDLIESIADEAREHLQNYINERDGA